MASSSRALALSVMRVGDAGERRRVEKGATAAPFYCGEASLPLLASLLLPALGFLRHCLLSPPSLGNRTIGSPSSAVAAAWHAHQTFGAARVGGTIHESRQGLSANRKIQLSLTREV